MVRVERETKVLALMVWVPKFNFDGATRLVHIAMIDIVQGYRLELQVRYSKLETCEIV